MPCFSAGAKAVTAGVMPCRNRVFRVDSAGLKAADLLSPEPVARAAMLIVGVLYSPLGRRDGMTAGVPAPHCLLGPTLALAAQQGQSTASNEQGFAGGARQYQCGCW